MIPNGVAGTADAAESSEVSVTTEQGSFAFSIRDLEFGRPLQSLGDLASSERIPTTLDLTTGETYNDYPSLAADPSRGMWVT